MNNLIYIAGPITNGGKCSHAQRWHNVVNAMEVYGILIDKGYAPILPHFSYFYHEHISSDRTHEEWLQLDFQYIDVCDYFYYMGAAKGSLKELEYAQVKRKIIFNFSWARDIPPYPFTPKSLRMAEA